MSSRLVPLVAVLLACGSAHALPISVVVERRFPVNLYCPIDNRAVNLTFVAEGPNVRLTFEGNNEFQGEWLQRRLDNIAVVAKSIYDAAGNTVVPNNLANCYESPGSPNTPAYYFNRSGTTEVFLDLFDSEADGWDLLLGAYFLPGPGVSATRDAAEGFGDVTGGALGLGKQTDGAINVKTSVLVSGLTTGVQYIVTGWWYMAELQPMTVTIDPSPCQDRDLDGVNECSDCDDKNPKRKPGLAEVCDGYDNDCDGLVDESTPCDRVCDVPQKVGGADLRITNAQFTSTNPAIVWNGTDFAMFYKDSRNGGQELFFSRASVAGAKIGTDLNLDPGNQSDMPHAVWTGGEYGVVWEENGIVAFRRFDRNGAPIGTTAFIGASSPGAFTPDIAWTGTEYGITWAQYVVTPEIFFTRFAADGTSLMLTPVQLSLAESPQDPRIAWNGAHYGVTWQGHDGSSQAVYFRRVTPLNPTVGSPIKLSPLVGGAGSFGPAIASGGGEWGVAWADYRNGFDTELYFARVAAAGTEIGTEVRVTNATGASFYPEVAWSGSEWGLVWEDYRSGNSDQWFGRVSAAGAKLGTDFNISNLINTTQQQGTIVWAGGKYAVAWNDDRNSGDQEIYFARVGCDCIDGDLDTHSSCVDCNDGSAATFAGASQVCDGFNNNCNDVNWPLLTGTNEVDGDGDTFTACTGDCNDANAAVWATPGETRFVLMTHDKLNNVTNLSWSAPVAPGATSLQYDTLRSPNPSNFIAVATCVETNNGPNTVSADPVIPSLGTCFYYLIRAENACPSGQGTLGTASNGTPRAARTCP